VIDYYNEEMKDILIPLLTFKTLFLDVDGGSYSQKLNNTQNHL